MTAAPHISVVMPVFNARTHLREAVDSVLSQSMPNFELVAIDDGSTDDSAALLRSYHDRRLRVVEQPRNLGIVGALNRGLKEARAPWVARMDADDVALPDRFARQFEVLSQSPDIAVLGSDFTRFGAEEGPGWVSHYEPDDVATALLFENPICHPTVMMRKATLGDAGYPPDYPHAEEYALWCRLAHTHRLANLPACLLRHRVHAGQVSQRRQAEQCASIDRIMLEQLKRIGLTEVSPGQLRLHQTLGKAFAPFPKLETELTRWIATLLAANAQSSCFPATGFANQLQQRKSAALSRHAKVLGAMPWWRRWRWRWRTAREIHL